jgi:tRNA pseudouridine38-40 synthase
MPRYRFVVEYVGSEFCGWQTQPNGNSVQQALEAALNTCLGSKAESFIRITGSGRTDAGVHSLGQMVHFDVETPIDTEAVESSLNGLTSKAIAVHNLEPCSQDFHARYDATYRYYRYTLSLGPTALDKHRVWEVYGGVNPSWFRSELQSLLGTHDFNGFSIPRKDGKSTLCTLTRGDLEVEGSRWVVHIQGDRFLHKMVRSIVGACYDVARGKHSLGLVQSILTNTFSGERTWAPPQGLVLWEVGYGQEKQTA